jgi:hypothetical protein
MKKLQKILIQFCAKMMLNEKQEVSFMKLGGNIAALAAVVLSMPSMGFEVSIDILNVAKLVLALAAALGWAGARDAIKK